MSDVHDRREAALLSARILVVDDKRDNVSLLEGMLRVAGYKAVEGTTDPRTVCELHRRNRYSLILLDIQMPGMDGFDVMRELKETETGGYLPVIAITAQPSHKLRALEAGAKDFVSKPFDMAELRARVRNVLEVRLLNGEALEYGRVQRELVLELETNREALRLKTIEEDERRAEELERAQQTQESLLPRRLPEIGNFRIGAYNSPTRYVGGDFYDFPPLADGRWAGVLADVAGKGMPAALLSSLVLGALNSELRAGTEPAEALRRTNLLVCEKSLPDQFVTMFLFAADAQGKGEFIGAGHNAVFLFRKATGAVERLHSENFFLGMFAGAEYRPMPLELLRGDILLIYSDGVTDAENAHGEMFGTARLLATIRKEAPQGCEALESGLRGAIEEFTGGSPQTDDITFVVVEKER